MIQKYIQSNWLAASVIAYMILSCFLKIITGFNITIPCIFSTVFGVHCPGCGLTSAFIELLRLNPINAWNHNPLIFIVIPAATLLVLMNFLRFRKKEMLTTFLN